jgi:hypothetical protein
VNSQCAGYADTLTLATGELMGKAVGTRAAHADQIKEFINSFTPRTTTRKSVSCQRLGDY